MYEIISKERLSETVFRIRVTAPRIARKAQAGQFVILRVDAEGERVPFTIADSDVEEGSVTVIFQAVGLETRKLAALEVGQCLRDVVGPLGNPSSEHWGDAKRVLCVGGGVGTAVVFPQVKALHRRGAKVDVITGARDQSLLILVDDLKEITQNLYLCTDDGSVGHHGLVTDVLKQLISQGEQYDLVLAIGPPIMMKAVCDVTREAGLPTIVSLNPIMVDGTGMCGCCRVVVDGQVKYACVDGPEFDGHKVEFTELMQRNRQFRDQEAQKEHKCRGGLYNG